MIYLLPDFRKFNLFFPAICQKEFERDYMEGFDKAKYESDLLAAAGDEAKKLELQANFEEKSEVDGKHSGENA